MLFLWFVVKVARLFAAVAIIKFQRAYQDRALVAIYDDRWATIDVTQKELFDSPKPWINIVGWRGVGFKTKSIQRVEWRLLIDLRLLTTGWVADHKNSRAREAARQSWAKVGVHELFQAHIRRGLLPEDEKTAARIYLRNKSRRRASEILGNHQRVTIGQLKYAAAHDMKVRLEGRAEDRLP